MHIRGELTWSSVFLVAIACGCSSAAAEEIVLKSVKPPRSTSTLPQSYGLTRDDAARIAKALPGVANVLPIRHMPHRARRGEQAMAVAVSGTPAAWAELAGIKIERGRYLTDADAAQFHNVAVIGAGVAKRLFALTNPIGENIRIGDDYFLVVGVAARVEEDEGAEVFMPLTTMRARFGDTVMRREAGTFEAERYELSEIRVVPADRAQLGAHKASIEALLKRTHERVDYSINVSYRD